MSNDPELLSRALAAVKKYQSHLDSEEKIARFAVWFLEQESEWHEVAKGEPPRGIPVLLWDTVHNIVRVGGIEVSGWHIQGDKGEKFTPHKWQKIRY